MESSRTGASNAIEVMLNASLSQLNKLRGANRDALYAEYKEWIELNNDYQVNDDILYCHYLGE